MREYWTWKYSTEQYRELMSRLNIIMLGEDPQNSVTDSDGHAYRSKLIVDNLSKRSRFFAIESNNLFKKWHDFCENNPNKINIGWCSLWADIDKGYYDLMNFGNNKNYFKLPNSLCFVALWNIYKEDGIIINKKIQENYDLPDWHSKYSNASLAHDKNDSVLDRYFLVSVWVDESWDIDQTNNYFESSQFPVWFHPRVLFASNEFPSRLWPTEAVRVSTWAPPTSHVNYVNVATAWILFQMKADVQDVDELLEKIRSTCLKNYIRLDGEVQELQRMNPAWFFKKYCMITDIPSTINAWEIVTLDKSRYKWLVFDIPGAEVMIDGEWIPYSKGNEALVKSKNPMDLMWRINGVLLRKYGYLQGQTIQGQILTVDDQWNGLRLEKALAIRLQ